MATPDDLKLFRAVYEGDLEVLKQIAADRKDLKDSHFVIQTDEICLCSTAFENLGLEFTNIASPSDHTEAMELPFDDGSAECALQGALESSTISLSQSICSVSRRVYEPPLYHWLEEGRCSHINARAEGDEDILHDLDENTEDTEPDVDDPAADIDLEVYGIRMSPYQIAEGVDQSITSGVKEQIRRLSLAEDIIEDGRESDDLSNSISSGPSFHDNLDIMGLVSSRTDDDQRTQQSSCKYPYIQGLDPIDSEAGSGILVSDIKQAGVSPMHVAAARGHNDVISYLLERGCDVDVTSWDAEESPLHLAVRWGRCDTAKLLLKHAANPHRLSALDCSPMHVAIELSCHECLKAMLDHLPNDNSVDLTTKQILLVYALSRDEVTLASVLLDKFGLDVTAPLAEGSQTLLHKAAMCGAPRCLRLLISRGASLDAASQEGETPLHLAAATGHVDCIAALVEAGAKPKAVPNWMFGDNQTPLMLAAYNNYPDAVTSLIPHDDVTIANEYGDTALHYAAYRGCEESVAVLLEAGALVNARNDYGATPLWNGACYSEIVRLLLQAGASLHVKSVGHNLDHVQGSVYDHPRTPLEIALEEGFLDSAQLLLLAGARIARHRALALLEDTQSRYGMETPSGQVFVDSIKELVHRVPSMKLLARAALLAVITDKQPTEAVKKLPLEEKLKSYLQYNDI